jgi:hypothetical protein
MTPQMRYPRKAALRKRWVRPALTAFVGGAWAVNRDTILHASPNTKAHCTPLSSVFRFHPLLLQVFISSGSAVAFVRVRLGLSRITNGTIGGSKGRFGQLCIADRHHENRDSFKCQAMCAILQLQHLACSALAQARTTALTPLQSLSSKAASQTYQEP